MQRAHGSSNLLPKSARVWCLIVALLVACAAAATRSDAQIGAVASPAAEQGGLFLFIYQAGPSWRAGVPMEQQGLGPHGAYMQRLMDEGRLFAGGGFVTSDGGMAVVMAKDIDAARSMLAADPAVTSGIFTARLERWRPRFLTDKPLPRS